MATIYDAIKQSQDDLHELAFEMDIHITNLEEAFYAIDIDKEARFKQSLQKLKEIHSKLY